MEKKKPELKNFSFGPKHALLLGAYTGIDRSQLDLLLPDQKLKICLGLVKQLELVTSLHLPKPDQPSTKEILKASLSHFINTNEVATEQLIAEGQAFLPDVHATTPLAVLP